MLWNETNSQATGIIGAVLLHLFAIASWIASYYFFNQAIEEVNRMLRDEERVEVRVSWDAVKIRRLYRRFYPAGDRIRRSYIAFFIGMAFLFGAVALLAYCGVLQIKF